MQQETPHVEAANGDALNECFTVEEVTQGIKGLQTGKACMGTLTAEALKAASRVVSVCVTALFNAVAGLGQLPQNWSTCRIAPVHKSGDPTCAANYRGLAVGTTMAKLYATVINGRLDAWAEGNDLRAWGQAGFRQHHSTADQALVLRTLVECSRENRKPLYTCFVDFQKAYDTVPRERMWCKLQRLGVNGRMLSAVKALYAQVIMQVQGDSGETESFQSYVGLKQGCPLSPLLFGLYIDDLEDSIITAEGDADLPTIGQSVIPPLGFCG